MAPRLLHWTHGPTALRVPAMAFLITKGTHTSLHRGRFSRMTGAAMNARYCDTGMAEYSLELA